MSERTGEDRAPSAGSSPVPVSGRRGGSIPAAATLKPVAAGIVLAGLAAIYGTLDGGDHPALSIGGAMLLAAGGTLALLLPTKQATTPRLAATSPLLLVVAWGSAECGLIHLAVVSQHFDEFWLYGLFFIVIGLGQIASAYIVIALPARSILVLIALVNFVIVAVWIITRTYGAVVGPDASKPARAGFGDIVSTALELVVSAAAVLIVARPHRGNPSDDGHSRELLNTVTAFAISLVSILALYSTVGGRPFVTHVG